MPFIMGRPMQQLLHLAFYTLIHIVRNSFGQVTDSLPNVTFPDWYFQTNFSSSRLLTNFSCENTEMLVNLQFDEPFWGKVMLEHAQQVPNCFFIGDGNTTFQFRVPLRGCGSTRTASGSSLEYNNAFTVLFDRSHLLEAGDLRKVVICRYETPATPAFLEVHQEPAHDLSSAVRSNHQRTTSICFADLLVLVVPFFMGFHH